MTIALCLVVHDCMAKEVCESLCARTLRRGPEAQGAKGAQDK